jgi:hypothetical protein
LSSLTSTFDATVSGSWDDLQHGHLCLPGRVQKLVVEGATSWRFYQLPGWVCYGCHAVSPFRRTCKFILLLGSEATAHRGYSVFTDLIDSFVTPHARQTPLQLNRDCCSICTFRGLKQPALRSFVYPPNKVLSFWHIYTYKTKASSTLLVLPISTWYCVSSVLACTSCRRGFWANGDLECCMAFCPCSRRPRNCFSKNRNNCSVKHFNST